MFKNKMTLVYFDNKVYSNSIHAHKAYCASLFLYSAGIYLLKVNNRNTRTRCEIRSKLTIKIPERHQASFWYLYCQLWTYSTPCSSVSVVNMQLPAGYTAFLDKHLPNPTMSFSLTIVCYLQNYFWCSFFLVPVVHSQK